MRSFRKELWFNIPTRRGFVNITSQVDGCLKESGIQEGLFLVYAMHITASVFINDDESGLASRLRGLAGKARAARADLRILAQPDRRRQCRRAYETTGDGTRSSSGDHERQAGFRAVGADLLRRVRRPQTETGAGQDYRGIIIPLLSIVLVGSGDNVLSRSGHLVLKA